VSSDTRSDIKRRRSNGAETKQTYVYEFMTVRNRRNWGWSVRGPARLQSMFIGCRSRTQSCPRRTAALLAQYRTLTVLAAAVTCGADGILETERRTVYHAIADYSQDPLHFCQLSAARAWFFLGLTVTEMCSRRSSQKNENRGAMELVRSGVRL